MNLIEENSYHILFPFRSLDYPENFGTYSYFPQCVCFLNRPGQNPNLAAFNSKIQVFCRPEWDKRGALMKINSAIFKCKNEFPKQLGLEKLMKKMGSFLWFSCLLTSWVMVFKLSKIVSFLQFFADKIFLL